MDYNKERWTSIEAENSMETHVVDKIDRMIVDYLDVCGPHGSTHQEAEQVFADLYGPSTIRARFRKLELAGKVKDTGKWRHTRAKRKAIVWVASTYSESTKTLEEWICTIKFDNEVQFRKHFRQHMQDTNKLLDKMRSTLQGMVATQSDSGLVFCDGIQDLKRLCKSLLKNQTRSHRLREEAQ